MPKEKRGGPSKTIEIRTTVPSQNGRRVFNLANNLKFQEFFISQRGEFLNASVEVENQLAFAIQVSLSQEITYASLFRTIVLGRLTFRQKVEVLAELLKNILELQTLSTKYKKLPEHLRSLNAIRNKYAHGKFFFQEDKPRLEFFRGSIRVDAISEKHIGADLIQVGKYKEELDSFVEDLVALTGSKGEAQHKAEGP